MRDEESTRDNYYSCRTPVMISACTRVYVRSRENALFSKDYDTDRFPVWVDAEKQFLRLARGGRGTRALNAKGRETGSKRPRVRNEPRGGPVYIGRRARHTGSPSSRVAYTMVVLSPAARPAQTAFNQFAVAARSLMPF